jgi:protein-disulfide isomerase
MLMKLRVRTATMFAAVVILAACGDGAPGAAESAKPTAAAQPAAASKWLETVAVTPEGGFRIGNPDAPVKLVEFASLTCPHCRDFHELAMPTLKGDYIATGKISYEFRNFVLNPADYAATMLARCSTPNAFFALSDAFFKNQSTWVEPFAALTAEQSKSLEGLPPDQQVVAYARLGKLDEFVRARGVPASKFEACLTDPKQRAQLEAIRKTAVEQFKVRGTPSFAINGELQDGVYSWADLEPKLKDAIG